MRRPLARSLLLASLCAACAQVHVQADGDPSGPHDAAVIPTDTPVPADDAAITPSPDAAITRCGVAGDIGWPCASDADCTVHASFSPSICMPASRGAPGGYCTSVCMVDAECGPCGRCVANMTGNAPSPSWYGYCVQACDAASACGAGYVCAPIDAAPRLGCFPDCRLSPGLCGAARCDASTGTCTLTCTDDADCSDGSHCAAGRCLCGAATACTAGSACGMTGCECTSDAACGTGHTCDTSIRCCRWGSGLCG